MDRVCERRTPFGGHGSGAAAPGGYTTRGSVAVTGAGMLVGQHGGMKITPRSFAHVRLTVTDIERSRAFYDAVFGLPVAFEVPADADEATREQLAFLFGGVIYQLGDSLLGLRPVAKDRFDEDRVGLDHLSLAVAGRDELESAVAVLDGQGVAHEGIKDIGAGYILEFRDPDNIALELFAPQP
ncbi:VOC family protein [Streptomyces sp. NPDC006733]|uniref:VOC family protein n=1 Tax=Streptomyces sp. NPDC006733 TaxID=3155460 RepID=UPI0033FF6A27